MVDYSKWDKMVKEFENMDSEGIAKNIKCEIGKPLTEEEFKKMKESESANILPVSTSSNSGGNNIKLDLNNVSNS